MKRFWNSLHQVRFKKIRLEDSADPRQYIGQKVLAAKEMGAEPEQIEIKHVLGSVAHPKYFEINGTHWVHMYSFFTQMMEGRIPTPEEMDEFELASQITKVKELNDGKKEGK